MREQPSKDSSHAVPLTRLSNIAMRTAHLGVAGILVGGHVFEIEPNRLLPWIYMTIITGMVLMMIEAYPSWRYWCEGRGALVVVKILLLCSILWLWDARVPILITVVVIGSVGSHMPRKFRHYSLIERRVVDRSE